MWETPQTNSECSSVTLMGSFGSSRAHLVKRCDLPGRALRQPSRTKVLVFVGIHQSKDDEERVVRMLQGSSTHELQTEPTSCSRNVSSKTENSEDMRTKFFYSYVMKDIVKARVLGGPVRHLGSHASGQLIHEWQELVGWDLLHSFLWSVSKKHKRVNCASSQIIVFFTWFTHLHGVVHHFDVGILQPERRQAEHPGVVLLALLQTADVVLHRLTQEALSVCPQVGQGFLIQLQLSLHFYCVPVTSTEGKLS